MALQSRTVPILAALNLAFKLLAEVLIFCGGGVTVITNCSASESTLKYSYWISNLSVIKSVTFSASKNSYSSCISSKPSYELLYFYSRRLNFINFGSSFLYCSRDFLKLVIWALITPRLCFNTLIWSASAILTRRMDKEWNSDLFINELTFYFNYVENWNLRWIFSFFVYG